jgi:ABC-type glycerol-3-phosphate transport system substrate-binding protein
MTDEELIARLRLYGSKFHHEFGPCVADRIEELIAEREKDHANINLKADFIEKTLNQLAEADAKLAKVMAAAGKMLDAFCVHEDSHQSAAYEAMCAALAETERETK